MSVREILKGIRGGVIFFDGFLWTMGDQGQLLKASAENIIYRAGIAFGGVWKVADE